MPTLREELTSLINRRSRENTSDTPDYILASYLEACLQAFEATIVERDRWHGFRPGHAAGAGELEGNRVP